ncbi:hypothetical protein L484_009519 [Morus notabilis]|uniref:Uncharacterized protein n=1 Tax=Morus notabilis TaxID=981085 RepID=W9RSL2_9ROSA|nr:hypothetical protein L484_009519 [Morus notabilis]
MLEKSPLKKEAQRRPACICLVKPSLAEASGHQTNGIKTREVVRGCFRAARGNVTLEVPAWSLIMDGGGANREGSGQVL